MSKAQKYDKTGNSTGQVDLPESLFLPEVSHGAIHTVIRVENANRRQGTHSTKDFSEVRGGGKKPWRQKGTGHARQGSIRAPQWKGGGIVFGPKPRDYGIRIPDKQRKAGMRNILSKKAIDGSVAVLEDLSFDSFSTKQAYSIFKNMGAMPGNTVAFITDKNDQKLKKSVMNIPGLVWIHAERLTAPEVLYSGQVVISESAIDTLVKMYGKKSAGVA